MDSSFLLDLLKKLPIWETITSVPSRLSAIEQRLTVLEKKLERCPGEGCKFCGELALRQVSEWFSALPAHANEREEVWRCEACTNETMRWRK